MNSLSLNYATCHAFGWVNGSEWVDHGGSMEKKSICSATFGVFLHGGGHPSADRVPSTLAKVEEALDLQELPCDLSTFHRQLREHSNAAAFGMRNGMTWWCLRIVWIPS